MTGEGGVLDTMEAGAATVTRQVHEGRNVAVGPTREAGRAEVPRERQMNPDEFSRAVLEVSLLAPIVLPLTLCWFSRRVVRRARHVAILLVGTAFLFMVAHCGDGDEWQWPSACIFVSALIFLASALLASAAVWIRLKFLTTRWDLRSQPQNPRMDADAAKPSEGEGRPESEEE